MTPNNNPLAAYPVYRRQLALVAVVLACTVIAAGCDWVDGTGADGSTAIIGPLPATADETVELLEEKLGVLNLAPGEDENGNPFQLSGWEVNESGALPECSNAFSLADAASDIGSACALSEFACSLFIRTDTAEDGAALANRVLLFPPQLALPVGIRVRFDFISAAHPQGQSLSVAEASVHEPGTRSKEVVFCIDAINEPPVAVDDEFSVAFGGTLSMPGYNYNAFCTDSTAANSDNGGSLISNDIDDNDRRAGCLVAELISLPRHAANDVAATFTAGGGFAYQHDPLSNARSDSFTYRLSDGEYVSAPATVAIAVDTESAAPVAIDDAYSVAVSSSRNIFYPLSNDLAPQGDQLRLVSLGEPDRGGSAVLRGIDQVVYTPVADSSGTENITYTMENAAGQTSTASMVISIR